MVWLPELGSLRMALPRMCHRRKWLGVVPREAFGGVEEGEWVGFEQEDSNPLPTRRPWKPTGQDSIIRLKSALEEAELQAPLLLARNTFECGSIKWQRCSRSLAPQYSRQRCSVKAAPSAPEMPAPSLRWLEEASALEARRSVTCHLAVAKGLEAKLR